MSLTTGSIKSSSEVQPPLNKQPSTSGASAACSNGSSFDPSSLQRSSFEQLTSMFDADRAVINEKASTLDSVTKLPQLTAATPVSTETATAVVTTAPGKGVTSAAAVTTTRKDVIADAVVGSSSPQNGVAGSTVLTAPEDGTADPAAAVSSPPEHRPATEGPPASNIVGAADGAGIVPENNTADTADGTRNAPENSIGDATSTVAENGTADVAPAAAIPATGTAADTADSACNAPENSVADTLPVTISPRAPSVGAVNNAPTDIAATAATDTTSASKFANSAEVTSAPRDCSIPDPEAPPITTLVDTSAPDTVTALASAIVNNVTSTFAAPANSIVDSAPDTFTPHVPPSAVVDNNTTTVPTPTNGIVDSILGTPTQLPVKKREREMALTSYYRPNETVADITPVLEPLRMSRRSGAAEQAGQSNRGETSVVEQDSGKESKGEHGKGQHGLGEQGNAEQGKWGAQVDKSPGEVFLGGEWGDSFDDALENLDTLEFLDLPDIFHEVEGEDETDRIDDYELLDVGPFDLSVFKSLWSPKRMLLRDKLAFLLGSTELWVCAYWLGHSPWSFYRFYIMEAVVLFAVRWVVYSRRKWHYYMLDFCYYANLLLMVHLFLFPSSRLLNRAMFAYTTGPLAWSIPAFRNSLVYHDLDKVTSVFLHFVPTCVSWTLRWHPDPERFKLFVGCKGKTREDCAQLLSTSHEPATFLEVVLVPLGPYVLWAVLYYLKIFVISAKRIQQRKYKTLFDYITSAKKGAFANLTRRVPMHLRPMVYFALHLLFCVFTFMFSLLLWHNFYLHSGFIIAVACMSIWHGGNYYFEVFAKKYISSLQATHADEEAWTPKRKAE